MKTTTGNRSGVILNITPVIEVPFDQYAKDKDFAVIALSEYLIVVKWEDGSRGNVPYPLGMMDFNKLAVGDSVVVGFTDGSLGLRYGAIDKA